MNKVAAARSSFHKLFKIKFWAPFLVDVWDVHPSAQLSCQFQQPSKLKPPSTSTPPSHLTKTKHQPLIKTIHIHLFFTVHLKEHHLLDFILHPTTLPQYHPPTQDPILFIFLFRVILQSQRVSIFHIKILFFPTKTFRQYIITTTLHSSSYPQFFRVRKPNITRLRLRT